MLIIGESLNATIPSVRQAVISHDAEKIAELARVQTECGANMLDVNAAVPGQDEVEDLVWMVKAVRQATELPLVLDSSSPDALEAALGVYSGPTPIINSITGEMTEGHQRLLELAVKHDCGLVAMCMDHNGIGNDPKVRFAVGEVLYRRTTDSGLRPGNLYLDPLVMAVAADFEAGVVSLKVLQLIKDNLPEVKTFCGASNISFGMPLRKLLNRTFVSMQAALRMDAFLVDVRNQELMSTLLASATLTGQDEWGMNYIKAYRSGRLGSK